jgi:hypothetical protein
MPPEPLLSRSVAHTFLELELKKDQWIVMTPWSEYTHCTYGRKPDAVIMIYARNSTDADRAAIMPSSPWHELAVSAAAAAGDNPLLSLPKFLEALQGGDRDEKLALLLRMHKQLFHKEAEEMRKLLHKAGVPLAALSIVQDAVDLCPICRQWKSGKAKPVLKVRAAPRWNHTVYCNLAFFSDVTVFVACDEATRFTVLASVEFKDEVSLETAFRRNWINFFGPCKVFRCDKESAFAGEAFGVFLERYGCQRKSKLRNNLIPGSESSTEGYSTSASCTLKCGRSYQQNTSQ